eukprot:jgi/Bigna1/73288/fgenesh1_pg.23_\
MNWLLVTFFSKATSGGLYCAVIFLASFLGIFGFNQETTATSKGFACLSAPMCFGLGIQQIFVFESAQQGVNPSNLSVVQNNFSMSTCIGLLVFDFFLYLALAVYLERVIPSEWGVAEPFYFCFLPSFWGCDGKKGNNEGEDPRNFDHRYEQNANEDAKVGIAIRNLEKRFGNQTAEEAAVKSINLDMYIGQIFSLLGHNGAGKTTTINMLTGMLPPTGGDAIIFGNNIIDQMKTIRKDLGVCPQHDILFENYTVREHLYLFSKIKGIPSGEIENAVRSTIREVGLTEKINTYSQSLSGGMKRKLSVGMALIGGSRAVILDEPTSGMDPYSRRSTWEMLKQAKQGRVLILTTHFMDEADQLGDRIAIMHLGRIKCCGSSLFLKKKYGVGYILTVDKKEGALTNAIQQLVQNSVNCPSAHPTGFPDMFDAIDKNKESWGVNSYSVSVTTLEEVFLKVGNQDDEKLDPELKRRYSSLMSGEDVPDDDDEKSGAAAPPPPIEPHPDDVKKEKLKSMKKPLLNDESLNTSGTSVNFQKLEGFERFKVHFVALMIKRWNFTKRDFWIWIWQIAIPAILLLGMIGLIVGAADLQVKDINIGVGEYNTPNYVPAGPTDYSVDPLSLIDNSQNSVLINATTPVGGDDLVLTEGCSYTNMTPTSSTDMARYLLCTWKEFEQTKYGAFLGPLGDDSSVRDQMNFSTIFTNTTAVFGLPAFLSLRNKARAREALRSKGASSASTFDISLTSSPWPKTAKQKAINQAFTGIAVTIAFAFVPAGVAGFIIRERQTGSKHLQIISGVNIVAYWLSNFAWDFLNFLPSCIIALIVFAIYDLEAYTGDAAGVVFLTSLLFALAIIPFTYCMSFLFKTPATGQVVMLLIYFLSGTILLIVSAILSVISSTKEINDKLKFVYRLVPSYCFGEVVSNLAILSINESSGGNKTNPAKWSTIGWPCVYMTLEAIIYTIILFLIEKILATPDLYARFFPAPAVDDENYEEDQDIVNERKRVQGNKALENWAPDALQVRGLRKVYSGPKVAVKDLWFGIPRGQCFGFLGINGAGKSTTLKMLTGDVLPTLGTANLAGKDILSEQEEVRSLIGYCPQFDALLPNLTARETLRMFATIKGVPPKSLEPYVFEMCKQLSLDMNGWLDKPCGGYSGGNKRKLSVGIALVGNPPIVFLDEPSTGMDPGARRFMWDLISSTMATRSVVLTTHSMEECEALCSRIGIMVGGRLRCIGSSSHLRARYGSGYQLDLKSESGKSFEIRSWVLNQTVNPVDMSIISFPIRLCQSLQPHANGSLLAPSPPPPANRIGVATTLTAKIIIAQVQKEFKGAKIIEDQGQYMKFRLDSTGRTLGSVFRIIESNKQRGIAEYSVSETTLEQIFLHFAKQQEEETGAVAGFVNGSRTHSHSTATVERKASLQETLLEREQKEGYMKL